jgi:FtsP/CotA-like multicopper oxidase with cupredoxin domain
LPERLSVSQALDPADAENRNSPRTFNFAMEGMMKWTINGRTYNGMEVTEDEIVKLNTTEVWRINNGGNISTKNQKDGRGMMGNNRGMMGNGSGMGNMMQMPHPVHIHQLQFNIINRNHENVDQNLWNAVKDGFIDEGRQDSVYLLPGMYMDLVMRFEDFKGLFLYHCHNLEHEDMGMMRNFKIE